MIKNITILITFFLIWSVQAQEIKIKLGKTDIAKNEYFKITVSVKNGNIKSVSEFPQIPGFRNAGTSSSSSTNIINGKMSTEVSYIQNYTPTREGKFVLKPFTMKVNGQEVHSEGATITVGPEKKRSRKQNPFGWDPFRDFFGRNDEPQEFMDVKDDAFFAITTDKNACYVGEGITYTMAFYVSSKNQAQMDFYKLDEQLKEILDKVKPKNAWEEPFQITQIKPQKVKINNKDYHKYTFYQSRFYPLNAEDIILPVAGLKMLKYKVAKRKSFWGNNLKEDFKTFYSQSKKIKVKELPEHPLKDVVAVGNYRLKDGINADEFESGRSFNYQFRIVGEGNIASIKEPVINETEYLQIYPPNEHTDINRQNGMVAGQKVFDYYMIPNEPGEISFENLFEWIYFNTEKERYDTLKPDLVINVTGESLKNNKILSTDFGDFYESMVVDDKVVSLKGGFNWLLVIQIILVLCAIGSIIIYYKK